MGKSRVVIIGAGFAGLSAAQYLSGVREQIDVVVVNKYETTHSRPLIPDVVSRAVPPSSILYPLITLKERYGFKLFCEEAQEVDFDSHRVYLSEHNVHYDYLIVAAGSQTAFPPSGSFREHALRLDSLHDANLVHDLVIGGSYNRFIVCGGGYVGVELASNLHELIKAKGMGSETIIVEMSDRIVSTLPVWMQHYIKDNLLKMGVKIELGVKVEDIGERRVRMSNGNVYDDALCIWTTGLIAPSLIKDWPFQKAERGRIVVDHTLRFRDDCFAAGDVACFKEKQSCLRMSVQASLRQGNLVARNVLALIKGEKPQRYHPCDFGQIVPMANGRSCGELLGVPVRGRVATILHYLINAYRSRSLVNVFKVGGFGSRNSIKR